MTALRRYALLGGGLAAVLWTVSVIVLEAGGNPAGPESTEEIAAHFRDHRSAILAAGTLHVLGGFLFLWFLAALASVLRGLEESLAWLRTAALVGGVAAGTMMLSLTGPQTTGATTDVDLLSGEGALGFWRLSHTFFVAAEFAFAVFVSAVSLIALNRVLLPRWLGWAGLFISLVLLIVPIGWIALLALVPIWLLVVSVLLFTRSRAGGAVVGGHVDPS